jgi:hypothetical protein
MDTDAPILLAPHELFEVYRIFSDPIQKFGENSLFEVEEPGACFRPYNASLFLKQVLIYCMA